MNALRITTRTARASAALRRVFDIAARVVRGITLLAIASAAAVSVGWLVWAADTPASRTDEWVARVVLLAVLLIPAAVLLLFLAGVRDLVRLPERARALPADLRERARDGLEPLSASRRGSILGAVASLVALGRVVIGSRDVLSPYAVVTIALRPAMVIASIFAALAAVVEIPAAVLAMLILALR